VPTSQPDKRLRADLAAELGWYPADLDDDSISRHRAEAARKTNDCDPSKRWAHRTELARQRDVAAAGRAAVADFVYSHMLPDDFDNLAYAMDTAARAATSSTDSAKTKPEDGCSTDGPVYWSGWIATLFSAPTNTEPGERASGVSGG
jgi:hypothetical protein